MGDTFAAIHNVSELAMLAALASVRFAMAFLLLPVLSQDTVPQLVRGAVFLAFGVVTLAMQPAVNVLGWSVSHWIGLFAKEAFLGLALGMLLAAVLWAFAAAGEIVEGSPTEIKRQRDVWTFARKMGSADPNWQLVATGE